MDLRMGKQRCINGTLEGGNYSAPVPVIGLYTAGASLACMLMMLYDIASALRGRKRWLPCKSFSLNSLTLSLLSIATKLPVDLTTAMPSPIDQLSKLSGTTLIVIAMGFTFPYLGSGDIHAHIPNLAALAIFVITVIVNICIQISTGVIVLFIPEHIIIIWCMLLMLARMLVFSYYFHRRQEYDDMQEKRATDKNYVFLKKGTGSLFHRVNVCYAKFYRSSTQFVVCKDARSAGFSGLSFAASVILMQAIIRSIFLKRMEFCSGTSDYDWSMRLIVITQVLAVLVGGFATIFRWLSMSALIDVDDQVKHGTGFWELFQCSVQHFFAICLLLFLYCLVQLVWFIPKYMMHTLGFFVSNSFSLGVAQGSYMRDREIQEFEHLIQEKNEKIDKWIFCKRVAELKEKVMGYRRRPDHLLRLLERTSPFQQLEVLSLHLRKENMRPYIVILATIAKASMPDSLCAPLLEAFREVKSVLYFIERNMSPGTYNSELFWLRKMKSDLKNMEPKVSSSYSYAIETLTRLRRSYSDSSMGFPYLLELETITQLIHSRRSSSIEDLYAYVEQLLVGVVRAFLAQLPNAIFQILKEEFAENYKSNIGEALKIMCRVEMLEDYIQWSFPTECNISRLISSEPPDTGAGNDSSDKEKVAVIVDGVAEDKVHHVPAVTICFD